MNSRFTIDIGAVMGEEAATKFWAIIRIDHYRASGVRTLPVESPAEVLVTSTRIFASAADARAHCAALQQRHDSTQIEYFVRAVSVPTSAIGSAEAVIRVSLTRFHPARHPSAEDVSVGPVWPTLEAAQAAARHTSLPTAFHQARFGFPRERRWSALPES